MTSRTWLSLFSLCALACAGRPGPTPETPPPAPKAASPEPDQEPAGDPPTVAESKESPPTCERPDEFGPVLVDIALYNKRRGASAKRFSEILTTKDKPIEACLVKGSLVELVRLRCDNGSNPFRSMDEAHASRAGNVGQGGSCGSIVDLYKVPCPEKTYDVFIDMYVCPSSTEVS